MTDHLPECPVVQFYKPTGVCICDRLRACEQRVREEVLAVAEGVIDANLDDLQFDIESARMVVRALEAIDGINSEEVDEDIALASEGGRVIDEWAKERRQTAERKPCGCTDAYYCEKCEPGKWWG